MLRLLSAMPSWALNISTDEGSAPFLGSLLQCLTTLTVKGFFLCFNVYVTEIISSNLNSLKLKVRLACKLTYIAI